MLSIFLQVLDNGSVVEFDQPYKLLKNELSVLRKLVDQTEKLEGSKLEMLANRPKRNDIEEEMDGETIDDEIDIKDKPVEVNLDDDWDVVAYSNDSEMLPLLKCDKQGRTQKLSRNGAVGFSAKRNAAQYGSTLKNAMSRLTFQNLQLFLNKDILAIYFQFIVKFYFINDQNDNC